MATPGTFPDTAISDLKDYEKDALEEGHDADEVADHSVTTHSHGEPEKTQPAITSTATDNNDRDIEKGDHATTVVAGEEVKTDVVPEDPNIVFWDGPDDPQNPMNWTAGKKWANMGMCSLFTFITPLASSMFAPGVPQVLKDFSSTNTLLATFVVSVYLLGFAFGPLLVAPLSEIYGRRWMYFGSNVLFIIFTIACAVSSNLNMLVGFRFLAGCVGSTPVTIGGGTIADVMPVQKRGGAMAIYAMGPLLGPVVGPVAGGYLVEATSWRWVFWVITIAAGVFTAVGFFVMQETYAPVILARKAARLRKETGNNDLRSKFDTGLTPAQHIKRALIRPSKMLVFSPIVAMMSLYMSVVYAILYLLFTTFTFVFEEYYHFSSGSAGLVYIALGIGMILGLGIVGTLSDRIIKGLMAKGVELKPEDRLPIPVTLGGGLCIPVGLFIYGWTAQHHVQWAVPLLGTLFVGVGLISIFMCVQTYLIDAFTIHAASAIAANTVLRSVFGALLPLAGLRMYDALSLGWGNSLLAFVALVLVPTPIIFKIYGERIRTSKRFQVKF